MNHARLERATAILEWPVAFLAVLVVPVVVLEDRATSPGVHEIAIILNWVIWMGFCADFVIRWASAASHKFLRHAWFDLLLIVLSPPFLVPTYVQAARSVRIFRLVRLVRFGRAAVIMGMGVRTALRLFQHRKFHYVALVAAAVMVMGAGAIYSIEHGTNRAITSFGDALWWAVITATTVGYGDVAPVTTLGRLVAVVLIVTGLGVISVFTATVASHFFDDTKETRQMAQVADRLAEVERKLDQLLARQSDRP